MADLSGMLSAVLDNPQMLSTLSSLLDGPADDSPALPPIDTEKLGSMLSALNGPPDDRCRLLIALKPFVSPDRKSRIDSAVQLLKLYEVAKGIGVL